MLLSEGGPPPSQEPPNCCTTGLKSVWNQIGGSKFSGGPRSEIKMEQLSGVSIKTEMFDVTKLKCSVTKISVPNIVSMGTL